MENIRFIYDTRESRFSNMECYYLYDIKTKEMIYDVKMNKTIIMIDRTNRLIYFMGMETEEHYILEKQFYYKLIKQFIEDEAYECSNYTVMKNCTGGEIYYKYMI